MPQEIEKIMVFKDLEELPGYLKYIPEYVPTAREKVVVLTQEQKASNLFLRVRFGTNQVCVLSERYFRTVRRDALRTKLLSQPRTTAIERILKTL